MTTSTNEDNYKMQKKEKKKEKCGGKGEGGRTDEELRRRDGRVGERSVFEDVETNSRFDIILKELHHKHDRHLGDITSEEEEKISQEKRGRKENWSGNTSRNKDQGRWSEGEETFSRTRREKVGLLFQVLLLVHPPARPAFHAL